MCEVATQKSFVSPNHLPLQEPQISNTRQQAEAPQQQTQLSTAQDGLDRGQAPLLARPQVQTGVEAAFQNSAGQQIAQNAIARPEVSRPTATLRELESPNAGVVDVETVEEPKNFWEKIKDFMAKAFEVIGDVVSTLLGWLGKIGQIAGSVAGVVGRFLPGAGQFLSGLASLGAASNPASEPRSNEPNVIVAPRPTLRN